MPQNNDNQKPKWVKKGKFNIKSIYENSMDTHMRHIELILRCEWPIELINIGHPVQLNNLSSLS